MQPRKNKDPVYIEKLIKQALKDPNASRRVRALSKLGFSGPRPKIVQACTKALKNSDKSVRGKAIQSLGTLGDPAEIAVLLEIAETEPSQDLRKEATEALKELKSVAKPGNKESQCIHTRPIATVLSFEPGILGRRPTEKFCNPPMSIVRIL